MSRSETSPLSLLKPWARWYPSTILRKGWGRKIRRNWRGTLTLDVLHERAYSPLRSNTLILGSHCSLKQENWGHGSALSRTQTPAGLLSQQELETRDYGPLKSNILLPQQRQRPPAPTGFCGQNGSLDCSRKQNWLNWWHLISSKCQEAAVRHYPTNAWGRSQLSLAGLDLSKG